MSSDQIRVHDLFHQIRESAGEVLKVLTAGGIQEVWEQPYDYGFGIGAAVVHLMQTDGVLTNYLVAKLRGEEFTLHPKIQEVSAIEDARERHLALSRLNLTGATHALKRYESLESLIDAYAIHRRDTVEALREVGQHHGWFFLSLPHPLFPDSVRHPAIVLARRLLVDHTYHHLGQMSLVAKSKGVELPLLYVDFS